MSTRPRTFVIQPDLPEHEVSQEELQALACQLGLVENASVEVRIVGKELRLTLTPLGRQALKEAGR